MKKAYMYMTDVLVLSKYDKNLKMWLNRQCFHEDQGSNSNRNKNMSWSFSYLPWLKMKVT